MTWLRAAFRSLSNRNYRLYFAGQSISVAGTWMQRLGQAWLVLELTGSGTLLGVTVAMQHVSTLAIGPWGGLLADRYDKRWIVLWTQAVAGLLALLLGVLTATGVVQLWMVLALALALGVADSVGRPARQTFVLEMVGTAHLTNAITLNSIVQNAGMLVGPALGGVLIAGVGLPASFLLNAVSYCAVVAGLMLMRTEELRPSARAPRLRGQLRHGMRYVRRNPELLGPLLLVAVAGMLAFEWTVTIPLLAREAWDGDAQTVGLMFSALGAGAILGGLIVAGSLAASATALLTAAWLFSLLLLLTAAAPVLPVAIIALLFLGAASIAFKALAQSLLQLLAAPEMHGRVMALTAVAMGGMRPIGAPPLGWVAETYGARVAMGIGGIAVAVAAAATLFYLKRGTPSQSLRPPRCSI